MLKAISCEVWKLELLRCLLLLASNGGRRAQLRLQARSWRDVPLCNGPHSGCVCQWCRDVCDPTVPMLPLAREATWPASCIADLVSQQAASNIGKRATLSRHLAGRQSSRVLCPASCGLAQICCAVT